MTKIIVLGTRGFPNVQGGVETHCLHLYSRLVKLGYDVTVITRKPYIDISIKEFEGVKFSPLWCPKSKFLEAFIHTFLGVFKARFMGCDVLHIHAIGPSIMVPLARILGLKVVITHHGPDYDRAKWNNIAKFVLKTGEGFGCMFANKIITISKHIADMIKALYSKDAIIIPNGVDMPEIIEDPAILDEYNLQKGKYSLTVGRFVPEKGFHDLIEAFSDCSEDSKIVIVGDADHHDEYSQNLRKLAAENKNVILTGRLTGKPLQVLYSNAQLFVLPSYHEGLPIVLLEAMSYGLNCIVSDIPANRAVELEGNRYFIAGDIVKLYEIIQYFKDNPLTAEQKQSQLDLIKTKYNWDTIATETVKVLDLSV